MIKRGSIRGNRQRHLVKAFPLRSSSPTVDTCPSKHICVVPIPASSHSCTSLMAHGHVSPALEPDSRPSHAAEHKSREETSRIS